jgi:hypothetical protein
MTSSFYTTHRGTINGLAMLLGIAALMTMSGQVFGADAGIKGMLTDAQKELEGATEGTAKLLKIILGIGAMIGVAGIVWGVMDSGNMKKITVGGAILLVVFVAWLVIGKLATQTKAEGATGAKAAMMQAPSGNQAGLAGTPERISVILRAA